MENEKMKIPWLPLSALIFYVSVLILGWIHIIPPRLEVLNFLENLYEDYGLIGIFIASLLEGIVYAGLYFPGSFIIVLSVILSDGTIRSLITISLIVALAITITSIVNYLLGSAIKHKNKKSVKISSKGLFFSMIHPNILAFYFFNAGIKRHNPLKIIFVPFLMFLYGLLYAIIITLFKEIIKNSIENSYILLSYILIWLIVSFIINLNSKAS